jgi:hypothetical protein
MVSDMQTTLCDNIGSSVERYTSSSIKDWVNRVSSYVAILTSEKSFSREIAECLVDSSLHAFSQCESKLLQRISEVRTLLNSPLNAQEIQKYSSNSTPLNFYILRCF